MNVPPIPANMQRIIVLGSTCSGKTTLSKMMAEITGGVHIELDAHRFLADWQVRTDADMLARVEIDIQAPRWVCDGNYSKARTILWTQADTAIFLDYPLPLIMWRITKRTITRHSRQTDLWGTGNRDNFFKHLRWNDESLYYWAIKTYRRRRIETPRSVTQPEYAHLRYIHLTSPRQTAAWLAAVDAAYQPK